MVIRAINSQHVPPGYSKEHAFPTTKKSCGYMKILIRVRKSFSSGDAKE